MMLQTTIAKKVDIIGIGLHKGLPVRMSLEPLDADSGIVFYRKDAGITIAAKPAFVVNTQMATVIGRDQIYVSTIEHLLSAISAYGIDNLRIVLDTDEVPIMDGSSVSFCMLLDEAGLAKLGKNKKIMKIKKEVEVREGEKYVKLLPASKLSYDFTIHFDHPVIGTQRHLFYFSKKGYIDQIARARTFGFLHEVQWLRSKNLALGGSLENAIVVDDKKILNADGLRFPDEFVRHKILDAIGDMSLLGMNFLGAYKSFAGSHHLNHRLTQALLADESNYDVIEISQERAPDFVKAFA